MKSSHHSIRGTIVLGCILFLVILGVLISVASTIQARRTFYRQSDSSLTHILNYVAQNINADDLQECVKTGVPSQAYAELQTLLNGLVDTYELAFLYIVRPGEQGTGIMINVCSATSEAERLAGETDMPLLETTDAYLEETLDVYRSFMDKNEVSFFEEYSGYGGFYTGCKPIFASNGESFALICADIPIDELNNSIVRFIIIDVSLTLLIGVVFIALALFWMHRTVIKPLSDLEKSASTFAQKQEAGSPEQLNFVPPKIRKDNELKSLSKAMVQMSQNMKRYIEDRFCAEARAQTAEQEAKDMTELAFQDALTHVKNKAAFDKACEELENEMAGGTPEFAFVMIDLNDLKQINDQYGHDHGDLYLIGCSQEICSVFKRSPVYRVGGDEFVVILRGKDYEQRASLCKGLQKVFLNYARSSDCAPWERYMAGVGHADYTGTAGETVSNVLKRADDAMYADKNKLKQVEG